MSGELHESTQELADALDFAGKRFDELKDEFDDVTLAVEHAEAADVLSEDDADVWRELQERLEEVWGDFNGYWLEHADKVRHEKERP